MRINAQKPDEFYINNSDHVITNDSDENALYRAFEELFVLIANGGANA